MLRAMAVEQRAEADDFDEPILPGDAPSDYERYLRTEELLALQKRPEERAHHDELLFQTVHQSSELWLKLAAEEVETAADALRERDIAAALRLLGRVALSLQYVTTQLDMLERMSPWEYQEIRRVLGHGSGFDSPGWRALRHAAPALVQEFHAIAAERGLDLVSTYTRGREHEDVYGLAEALVELDERATAWRIRHFQVVSRVIGDKVVGTQGTPVEVLGRLIHTRFFPELWEVRNRLTALAKEQEATEADADTPGHGK
jgi:tryptophan 2,3-dioxygenase